MNTAEMAEYPAFDVANIEQFVVYENTHSSNRANRRVILDNLQSGPLAHKMLHVETAAEPGARTEQLVSLLSEGRALITLGGEGTVNEGVTVLCCHFSGQEIPFLPLHGGNGNDGPSIFNGPFKRLSPTKLLQQARVAPVHPIEGTIRIGDTVQRRYALLYAGIGATARGAWELNRPDYRQQPGYDNPLMRRWIELQQARKTLPAMKPFRAETRADGITRELADITVVNGPRMAKYLRWPVDLQSREVLVSQVADVAVPTLIRWGARNALARYLPFVPPAASRLQYGQQASYCVTADEPVLAHFDAETLWLDPRGSEVSFQQTAEPVYALSTRLKRPEER